MTEENPIQSKENKKEVNDDGGPVCVRSCLIMINGSIGHMGRMDANEASGPETFANDKDQNALN
jgi:hypothetical protein